MTEVMRNSPSTSIPNSAAALRDSANARKAQPMRVCLSHHSRTAMRTNARRII